MKKIMFYCHVFYPQNTGYSNAFQNIINSILESKEFEVTVVTPYPLGSNIEEIEKEGLKVVRLQPKINVRKIRYFVNDYFYAKDVSNLFKKEDFDMLLVETFDQSIFISCLDPSLYEKTAVRIHATNETEYTIYENKIEYRLRRFLLKKYVSKKINWILSTNSFHIKFAKKHFYNDNLIDIANKNFFVLPNTVSIEKPSSYDVGDRIKLFSLGRMDYLGNNQKGFTDFIYALKLLPQDVLNKFEVKIVGDGNLRGNLVEQCQGMDNIAFVKSMPHEEIISELKRSDAVVLPSRYEGLSMFALEGLSTGNLCIFADAGGLSDMVENNGFLFEPQNIEALRTKLIDLAGLNKEKIIQMKKNSIRLCEQRYSSSVVLEKFKSIFEIIVKGNR